MKLTIPCKCNRIGLELSNGHSQHVIRLQCSVRWLGKCCDLNFVLLTHYCQSQRAQYVQAVRYRIIYNGMFSKSLSPLVITWSAGHCLMFSYGLVASHLEQTKLWVRAGLGHCCAWKKATPISSKSPVMSVKCQARCHTYGTYWLLTTFKFSRIFGKIRSLLGRSQTWQGNAKVSQLCVSSF